jgi:hypothetical protein
VHAGLIDAGQLHSLAVCINIYLGSSALGVGYARLPAGAGHWGGVTMGTWFWLNMPLAVVFVCCWAGIPLWLTLTRWSAELAAKHAEVTPKVAVAPVVAQPVPASAAAPGTGSPAYAGVAEPLGR